MSSPRVLKNILPVKPDPIYCRSPVLEIERMTASAMGPYISPQKSCNLLTTLWTMNASKQTLISFNFLMNELRGSFAVKVTKTVIDEKSGVMREMKENVDEINKKNRRNLTIEEEHEVKKEHKVKKEHTFFFSSLS